MRKIADIRVCEECGKKFDSARKRNGRWSKISCSRKCGLKLRTKDEYKRIKERRGGLKNEV